MSPRALPRLAVALLLAACAERHAAAPPATVFAAASLSAPFGSLAAEYERLHPEQRIELHCAGTPQLVVQLREGAPVDLFASADLPSMRAVEALGLTAGPPRVFARNRLAIVTPKGNPAGVRGLADLARADLTVLLCGPDVPAGRYARQALASAGVEARSASDEPSVKAVVSKVALGEADAGLVYVTDAAGARERVDAVPLPAAHDVVGEYPLAVLGAGRAREVAEGFAAFVLSERGGELLRSYGFETP